MSASSELNEASGDGMTPEERMYLEQLEKSVKAEREDPSSAEAEERRREWERITQNFKPTTPLYRERTGDLKAVSNRQERPGQPEGARKSYQDDPRYKQFYENLKRTQPKPSYDEELQPMSLEELERNGWGLHPASAPQPPQPAAPAAAPRPSPSALSRPSQPAPQARPAPSNELVPGSILRLDDGSVAIYKDAVSGKDYALLYFLEAGGVMAARGIFLEQYGKQRIGALPMDLFELMKEQGRWDRDLVIYHLDHYKYIPHIRKVERATPVAGAIAERRRTPSVEPQEVKSRPVTEGVGTVEEQRPAAPPERPAAAREMLERGRVVRINIGGKMWDAVYWTKDEIGPIVAHNTHKEWALMHLDLTRFKDSIEYGDLLSPEKLSEIEEALAQQPH